MQPDFGESVVRIRKNEIFPSEMFGNEKQSRVKINPMQIQYEEQTQPKPEVMLVKESKVKQEIKQEVKQEIYQEVNPQNDVPLESEPQKAESVFEANTESHSLKLDVKGPIKLTSQVHGLSITFPSFNLIVQDLSKINTQELFKELIQWIKTLKNV